MDPDKYKKPKFLTFKGSLPKHVLEPLQIAAPESQAPPSQAEINYSVQGPNSATPLDEEQAKLFLEKVAQGQTPTQAARSLSTSVRALLNNPAVKNIMDWAGIDAKTRKDIVIGRLTKIVAEADPKEATGAAKVLATHDSDLQMSGHQPPAPQVSIFSDDVKMLIQNVPKVPGLEGDD